MPSELPTDIELQPDEYGWTAKLSATRGLYFGLPTRLEIDTWDGPEEGKSPPAPAGKEIALACRVLENLTYILSEAETRLKAWIIEDEGKEAAEAFRAHLSGPRIWIDYEMNENGSEWALVVDRLDRPTFSYHVEFDGIVCTDAWGASAE